MTTPVSGLPRGIHAVWITPEGHIGVCCECRTRTEIPIKADGVTDLDHIDLREQAFTCDGCGTVHWFTLGGKPGKESS